MIQLSCLVAESSLGLKAKKKEEKDGSLHTNDRLSFKPSFSHWAEEQGIWQMSYIYWTSKVLKSIV